MFIIADENAMWICRECCLAGAGKTEKQRAVALVADVRGAMHRHHVLSRQIEIQRSKYGLLHFTRIRRATDQNDFASEIDRHHRIRPLSTAVAFGIGPERWKIENSEFRNKVLQIRPLGADEQLTNEQRVPGKLGKDACLDSVFGVGAAIQVLSIELLAFGVLQEIGKKIVEILRRHLAIAVPPYRIFRKVIDDSVLIFGAATRVVTGLGTKRAARDQ